MTADNQWFINIIDHQDVPTLADGIWRLHPQRESHFFADYLPASFLTQLESARTLGWRKAVEQGLPLLSPYVADYTRDYFLESYRSDFVNDLNLCPGELVLDVGCGWGFASHRCLEAGARVVGTDNSIKRLDFCTTRFEQEGYSDSFVGIELDANRDLPFKVKSFDAIILSGIVEWLPQLTYGEPSNVQFSFMRKMTDLLRPGGRLYLAIENRYWWKYFIGARDLHTLQRLTSILPRRIARAYSMLTKGEDYRVYTYSLLTYIRMFRNLGFQQLNVTYPDPDYVQPKKVYPLIRNLHLQQLHLPLLRAIIQQRPNLQRSVFGRSFMFVAIIDIRR